MNRDFILKLVRPQLNSKNELTYIEFENMFASWKRQEQYAICEILESSGISLVDEKTTESDNINVTEINAKNKKEIIIKKTDLEYPPNNTTDKLQDIKLDIHENCDERLAMLYQKTDYSYYVDKLIQKHIGFIRKRVNIIGKYYNHNFEEEELLQVAKIGFMKGCKRFDINKGKNLLTYVGWWIDQALYREIINNGFLVRLPVHIWDKIKKVTRFLSSNDDADIEYFLEKENMSEAEYDAIIQYQQKYLNPASLDAKIGNCENVDLMDAISQDVHCFLSRFEEADEILEEKDLTDLIRYILNQLSTKERDVMILRCGLDNNGTEKTLEEIGQQYGVSRERIRQIEHRAKMKIAKILRTKINTDDEIIKEMKSNTPMEFDKNYFFKKNNVSYVPELSEMIDRIIDLNSQENDNEKLYEKFKICARQNGYNIQNLNKKDILNKFNQRKDCYVRNN